MTISVTFQFDEAEHLRAVSVMQRQLWVRWLPIIGAAFVLAGVAFYASGISGVAPWFFVLALWTVLFPLAMRFDAKRRLKGDVSVHGTQERRVDGSGFHSKGNGVALDLPWHSFSRAVETEEFFLLFYSKQCAVYLGKSHLSGDQLNSMRELVHEKLSGRVTLERRVRAA